MNRRRRQRRNSYTVDRGNNASPNGGSRGCLCKDEKTYSSSCCDGSLWAQGIGRITAVNE
ncbi:MAG: hypothetical protein EBY39_03085 [Flavobacteriia bacterium]|nr:hypothetical protein [Flavobacteriia bacterium]